MFLRIQHECNLIWKNVSKESQNLNFCRILISSQWYHLKVKMLNYPGVLLDWNRLYFPKVMQTFYQHWILAQRFAAAKYIWGWNKNRFIEANGHFRRLIPAEKEEQREIAIENHQKGVPLDGIDRSCRTLHSCHTCIELEYDRCDPGKRDSKLKQLLRSNSFAPHSR